MIDPNKTKQTQLNSLEANLKKKKKIYINLILKNSTDLFDYIYTVYKLT